MKKKIGTVVSGESTLEKEKRRKAAKLATVTPGESTLSPETKKPLRTFIVSVMTVKKHKRYSKFITTNKRYPVDNSEGATVKYGDLVEISETKPLSKTKSWKLEKVIRYTRRK